MKIVVTGSLGNVGKPLAENLIAAGHEVTVISSSPAKKSDIESIGAKAAIGSLSDSGFVTSTLSGADAVFLMVPPNFSVADSRIYYKEIGASYIQAIKDSGIKRVVHLSSTGADLSEGTGFILGSHDMEGMLNELNDIHLTHLRPGYFFNNLFNFAGMIKAAGFMGANYGGDDKIVMAHPDDIAAAAAEELQKISDMQKVRYVVSDDRTANEVAGILGQAIGKPDLKWQIISDDEMTKGMEGAGVPAHVVPNFVEMGRSIHSGVIRSDYDRQPGITGKTKLEDFAKEFAAAF